MNIEKLWKKYREDFLGAFLLFTSIIGAVALTLTILVIFRTATNLYVLSDNIKVADNTGTPTDEWKKEIAEYYESPQIVVRWFSNLHVALKIFVLLVGGVYIVLQFSLYALLFLHVRKYRLKKRQQSKLLSLPRTDDSQKA